MSKNKIENILTDIELPDFILPTSKERLREELLEKAELNFKKKMHKQKRIKYLSSIAATIILVLFLLLELPTQTISAKEIAQNLEKTYLNTYKKANIHYFKKLFKSIKKNSSFIMESWKYNKDLIRVQFKNKNNGQLINHTIINKHKTYELINPASKLKLKIRHFNKGKHYNKDKNRSVQMKKIKIVINKLKEKNKNKRAKVLIIKDSPDIINFSSQVPENIYSKLKSNPLVTYKGSKYDQSTGKEMEVFEKKTLLNYRSYIIEYENNLDEKINWFLRKLNEKQIKLSDTGKGSDKDNKNKTLIAIETTKINKISGRIISINYSLFNNSELIHQYELIFLEDKFIKYDKSIFNPDLYKLKSID